MIRFLLSGLTLLALLPAPALLSAGEAKDKAGPLELTIVAKKTTFQLDLGGKTAEEFRQALKDAAKTGRYPAAPAVDLTLKLKNTSDKDIQVWISGDPTKILLDLKGPGAINEELQGLASTLEFRVPKAVTLAPGKSHTFDIRSLTHGQRGSSHRSYWVEPGDYTLTARFVTGVSPAPPGAEKAEGDFGRVTITSPPLKLKVEAK
jgi:hypothetical protein